jgi:hypothetical protein
MIYLTLLLSFLAKQKMPKSSPEVEVTSGGIGCKEVEILLTPVQKGDWCCCVQIIGIADNHLETNPVPKQLTM